MVLRSIASRLAVWVLAGTLLVVVAGGLLLFRVIRQQVLEQTHRESAALASDTATNPGAAAISSSSRCQTRSLLANTVVAKGRVIRNAALACPASQCSRPMLRATSRALPRPAMASIRVKAMGMDAEIPVVVAKPGSTTHLRSATRVIDGSIRRSLSR